MEPTQDWNPLRPKPRVTLYHHKEPVAFGPHDSRSHAPILSHLFSLLDAPRIPFPLGLLLTLGADQSGSPETFLGAGKIVWGVR